MADLGQGRSSRRNLLSLLDNLFGIGLDLLFLSSTILVNFFILLLRDSFIFLILASLLILISLLTFSVISAD